MTTVSMIASAMTVNFWTLVITVSNTTSHALGSVCVNSLRSYCDELPGSASRPYQLGSFVPRPQKLIIVELAIIGRKICHSGGLPTTNVTGRGRDLPKVTTAMKANLAVKGTRSVSLADTRSSRRQSEVLSECASRARSQHLPYRPQG